MASRSTEMEMRVEKDSLGEKQVPAQAYYGIHTARALENFPISGLKAHPKLVETYVIIKKAAALTNSELGLLEVDRARAIVEACNELLAGKLQDQIVVDVFNAGAGTSLNMNVNEVIANRAIEILGGKKGDYRLVHPNDHVNMAQSTNDTFPTAMRMAAIAVLRELIPVVRALEKALTDRGWEFDGIVKSGRTHLQDAVPIRLGQEFRAYAATINKCAARIESSCASLAEVGIGGSAVGTGFNVHPEYPARMVAKLSQEAGLEVKLAPDLREAMQSNMPIAEASSCLRLLALELTRIANDLRLLSSGPRTGLNEITLPPVQAGSSIMPGKVNPTMAEVLNMVCFQVIGNDTTIAMAVQAGQLELNVMMPVMAFNLLTSAEILKNVLNVFRDRCIEGIVANPEECSRYFRESVGLATVLNSYIGYEAAAKVAREAWETGKRIDQLILEKGLLTKEELEQALEPGSITEPGAPIKSHRGS